MDIQITYNVGRCFDENVPPVFNVLYVFNSKVFCFHFKALFFVLNGIMYVFATASSCVGRNHFDDSFGQLLIACRMSSYISFVYCSSIYSLPLLFIRYFAAIFCSWIT